MNAMMKCTQDISQGIKAISQAREEEQ